VRQLSFKGLVLFGCTAIVAAKAPIKIKNIISAIDEINNNLLELTLSHFLHDNIEYL